MIFNNAFWKARRAPTFLSGRGGLSSGAAGRGRTDTVSLPRDFESRASANFTTAANYFLKNANDEGKACIFFCNLLK